MAFATPRPAPTPRDPADPAPVPALLSRQAFDRVRAFFQQASGIALADNKYSLVANRLMRLASDVGSPHLDAYVAHVLGPAATPDEQARLVDRLTINETYFFRESAHFDHLAALARQRRERSPGREFLVWSAAASSGEEAFTAAMVLQEVLGAAPWRVIGTDLSGEMVDVARAGLYPLERGRHIPPALLQRHCLKGVGSYAGQFLVSRELRSRVSFLQGNLLGVLPELPRFDVIFLRNVLIYFDADPKRQIVMRVLQQLAEGGLLYTGHAENLSGLDLPLQLVQTAIYSPRRPGAGPTAAQAPLPDR
ncbi:MAG: protein-glutamate O-methyltransferase CheR [Ideonella sp.]|nr:protein-glutamate O-methyltransferase CheR [Ideonella sp.]